MLMHIHVIIILLCYGVVSNMQNSVQHILHGKLPPTLCDDSNSLFSYSASISLFLSLVLLTLGKILIFS